MSSSSTPLSVYLNDILGYNDPQMPATKLRKFRLSILLCNIFKHSLAREDYRIKNVLDPVIGEKYLLLETVIQIF